MTGVLGTPAPTPGCASGWACRPRAHGPLADWVLSPMPEEDDEDVVVGLLLDELSRAVAVWADEGVEVAMNRFNR